MFFRRLGGKNRLVANRIGIGKRGGKGAAPEVYGLIESLRSDEKKTGTSQERHQAKRGKRADLVPSPERGGVSETVRGESR